LGEYLDVLTFILEVPDQAGGHLLEQDEPWRYFSWELSLRQYFGYKVKTGAPMDMVWHDNSKPFKKNINHLIRLKSHSLELSSLNNANLVTIETLCCFVFEDYEGVKR
jgi:hypothetical protein